MPASPAVSPVIPVGVEASRGGDFKRRENMDDHALFGQVPDVRRISGTNDCPK